MPQRQGIAGRHDVSPGALEGGGVALSYLTGIGGGISGALLASATVNVSGTSVYDGSTLSGTSGDITFYIDPAATTVNIDGQLVRRTTVETVQ